MSREENHSHYTVILTQLHFTMSICHKDTSESLEYISGFNLIKHICYRSKANKRNNKKTQEEESPEDDRKFDGKD